MFKEDTNNVLKEIMREPKSVVTGILTYDGKVLNSPMEKDLDAYIPHLGPFTKRCMLVAKSLDPHAEALGYSLWTSFGTYTIVFGEEFYAFARQDPIVLPIITPKPIEELSETERKLRLDEERKQTIRLEKEKAIAKEEAAIKLELLKKERLKRKTTYEKEQLKKLEISEDDLTEEESESSESSETEEEDEGEMADY